MYIVNLLPKHYPYLRDATTKGLEMAISALELSVFKTRQSARHVDGALKQAVCTLEQAEHNAVLWFGEMLRRKLYRKLGYSSINQYAAMELKFSRSKTGDFIRLARKLDELPAVRKSVASGEVGYTKAREIIKVATPATESAWVEAATKHSRRELEKKVSAVRLRARVRRRSDPGQGELLVAAAELGGGADRATSCSDELLAEIPVRESLEMTPEQFARYEALWEQLHQQGGVPTGGAKVELLLEALAGLVAGRGCADVRASESADENLPGEADRMTPRGAHRMTSQRVDQMTPRGAHRTTPRGAVTAPPAGAGETGKSPPAPRDTTSPRFQIHIHQCPDCGRATIQTGRGERAIGRAELERVQCDAQIKAPGKRNTTAIPPATRREVLARDRHQCQGPGCENTRFLEVHHITPRQNGGSNQPDNLITLCAGCHRVWHEQGLGR